MTKFSVYTFYKADGTKQLIYGSSVENALNDAGYSTKWIAENIRAYRKGFSNDLHFINGKWQSKETKNKIPVLKIFKN